MTGPIDAGARDKAIMTRRDLWVVGTVVVLIAVALGVWRASTGADTRTAVLAGVSVVFITGVGLTVNQLALTVNQLAARKRARRRTGR